MDFSVITDNLDYFLLGAYPNGPLGGAALTLLLSALSGLTAAVLGLVLGIALVLVKGWFRWVLLGVLGFLRAIPVLMLIFWSYFLLPIIFHVDIPALATVVCALSLIGGAYLAHSVHAGIQSLPLGQWAAAQALGMGPLQVLRLIILPQALPIMLPSFLNQWITLIKDTSLAYVIGIGELSFVATQVSNRVMVYPTEIFLFVALVYFVFCSSLDLAANLLSKNTSQRGRTQRKAPLSM
jgi:polar amino acid transport system permease protein